MDVRAVAASYLTDPLVMGGLVAFLALLGARRLAQAGVIRPPPTSAAAGVLRLALSYGFALGLLVLGIGIYLKSEALRDALPSGPGGAAPAAGAVREVDFGFLELDPGRSVAVPSYKYGGTMVLYSGEEFEYHAQYDGPMPPLELRVGEAMQPLPGPAGRIRVVGPPNRPLPAVLLAGGNRLSLPGGPPSRIAVKVQVFGANRPR